MPNNFSEAATALRDVSESIGELGASISYSRKNSSGGLSLARAKEIREAMKYLVVQSSSLATSQFLQFVPAMDYYIMNPSVTSWEDVRRNADGILRAVKVVRNALASDRSDFVLEKSYRTLDRVLGQRLSTLGELLGSKAPPEVTEFKAFRNRYVELIKSLDAAIDELTAYIKASTLLENSETMVITPSNIKTATLPILFISTMITLAGIVFAGFGLWLAFGAGGIAGSAIRIFGQEIQTESVGVACIFIGAVTFGVSIRRTLKTLDLAISK